MRTSKSLCALATGATLFLAACATVPPGPPPDVVRLQSDLDRLHSDPRIANNAGPELANADAAVDVLARNARVLDSRANTQGVYLAGKLGGIAEATALARYAELRGECGCSGVVRVRPRLDLVAGRQRLGREGGADALPA